MRGLKNLAKNKKKRNRSFILTLALILIAGYFLITFINLRLDISDKNEDLKKVNQQYQSQLSKNEELRQISKNGDQSKYIERVARDVLGYVLPGERVYYNTSSGI